MSSKGQRGLLDIKFGQVEQEYPARVAYHDLHPRAHFETAI
jgi:hypothetical protein